MSDSDEAWRPGQTNDPATPDPSAGPDDAAEVHDPATAEEAPAGAAPAASGASPADERPHDVNHTAIEQAGLTSDYADWLREVAGQVDERLDRVNPQWRSAAQASAARVCAFGLLLGQLAEFYPNTKPHLSAVAEAHPSFTTLPTGQRLQTLAELVADRGRMAAWLAPLVEVDDSEVKRTSALLD